MTLVPDASTAGAAQAMAQFHVLEDRQEALVEAAAGAEVLGPDRQRVRRHVVRPVRLPRLVEVDEDRLERREEARVGGRGI